jgi:hypothetical protein
LQSKKLHTVGDLARLSESDVLALPIALPKLATARAALNAHAQMRKRQDEKMNERLGEEVRG